METLRGVFGIFAIIFIAYLFSNRKNQINWRIVSTAFLIQFFLAVFALKIPFGRWILEKISVGANTLIGSVNEGIVFLFGPILPKEGMIFAHFNFISFRPHATNHSKNGWIFVKNNWNLKT